MFWHCCTSTLSGKAFDVLGAITSRTITLIKQQLLGGLRFSYENTNKARLNIMCNKLKRKYSESQIVLIVVCFKNDNKIDHEKMQNIASSFFNLPMEAATKKKKLATAYNSS